MEMQKGSFSRSSYSLRPYGKLYEGTPNRDFPTQDGEELNIRRRRNRCILASFCGMMALIVVVTLAAVLAVRAGNGHGSPVSVDQQELTGPAAIAASCNGTTYPDLCYQWISSEPESKDATPLTIVDLGIKVALKQVDEASVLASKLFLNSNLSVFSKQAINDCLELMDLSHDQLNDSVSTLVSINIASFESSLTEVKRSLSGTMGFHLACSEGLLEIPADNTSLSVLVDSQDKVGKGLIISLDLADKVSTFVEHFTSSKDSLPNVHLRRLLSMEPSQKSNQKLPPFGFSVDDDTFPEWLSAEDREVLQDTPSATESSAQRSVTSLTTLLSTSEAAASVAAPAGGAYDVVVAQDGSGKYKTIQEALNNVPKKRSTRYTIYIKKGVYNEYLNIPKSMKLLTLVGDGMGRTIISGDKSFAKGDTTYDSATVGISGPNFIARKITFRNTAGPQDHQAVALRVNSDQAVFDSCGFEGYEDTLYALANRQFYTGCNIYGTVDFIFGNAIAVFQSCNILGRLPSKNQRNTFTAQGRTVSSDPSGFSFQKCIIRAAPDLQTPPYPIQSYLGRPWKAFSRTVFMQCTITQVINPAGWLPWDATNPFTDTLYYGEYQNTGAGADTSKRVAWKGVHRAMSPSEASMFSVNSFISGTSWLPQANVVFQASL
ncbi:hypothetical protein KP509_19G056000 [Ceratopteris richardii]|uniref:Pectinesterase n=1 Tax=Ceratopteris richardii TaxID=49495 RepID=A0A8T2SML7_CERRI|nr:hypothetical protein KP509_19G056000 [Ceratopteris richardii]KAH7352648.1 hypothetical protein KP509_19G056000 [Ceratopteris richardii]